MLITVLKSKIHRATITGMDASYEGSILVDADLMKEVGLRVWEKVLVANINSGERFETYVIEGGKGSGAIELNGAAAHLGQARDRITIFAFTGIPESEADGYTPRIIQLDENNRIVRKSFE